MTSTLAESRRTLFEGEQRGSVPLAATIPDALSGRFTKVRDLVEPRRERAVMLVESARDGSRMVLKLARVRERLADPGLVRTGTCDPSLALPSEQGSLDSGIHYELQPFRSGPTLEAWLAARGPLGEQDVLELGRELHRCVSALSVTDGPGGGSWAHCDLKPENVIVESDRPLAIALVDFGSAARIDGLSASHERGRTLAYSAPELAHGEAFESSDCWSIGMILFRAFLGRHPMIAPGMDTPPERVFRVQLGSGWQARSTGAPPSLSPLFEGLLTASPLERWSLLTLRRFLAGENVEESPAQRELDRRTRGRQAYRIGDSDCETAEQAALLFARDWSVGVSCVRDERFRHWLREGAGRADLADSLAGMRSGGEDDALLRFVYRAAPTLPPVWRGRSLDSSGLANLVARAMDERDSAGGLGGLRSALQQIAWLRAGFVPDEPCARVTSEWSEIESQMNLRLRELAGAGMPAAGYGAVPDITAMSLLAAVDSASVERLRRDVGVALADNTARASWFFAWGRDAGAMNSAQVILLHALRLHSEANTGVNAQGGVAAGRNDGKGPADVEGVSPRAAERVVLTYRFRFRGGLG